MTTRRVHAEPHRSPRPKVTVTCCGCAKSFSAFASEVDRGRHRVCSQACQDATVAAAVHARFWAQVDRADPDGCWPWLGRCRNGYPIAGRRGSARRVMWELTHGPLPDGTLIRLTCERRECLQPAHLAADAATDPAPPRHRVPRLLGEETSQAKLTADLVRVLRRRHAAGDVSYRALAAEVGVSEQAVASAIRGDTWAHVD